MNEWCVRVCLFFFRFRNIEFTYVFLQIEYRFFLTFEVLQSICSSCNRYIWIHILINPFYFIILIRCWFFLIYFVHVVFIAYIFSLHHSIYREHYITVPRTYIYIYPCSYTTSHVIIAEYYDLIKCFYCIYSNEFNDRSICTNLILKVVYYTVHTSYICILSL